jgi:hypothetical protein
MQPTHTARGLLPQVISEKNWNTEHDGYKKTDLTWVDSVLALSFSYGGGGVHPFKAYIIDTSNGQKKTYNLLIEDQNKNVDGRDAIQYVELPIDLKEFAQSGTVFKVMKLVYNNDAMVMGITTFK